MTAIITYADGDIIPVIDTSEALDADKNKTITKTLLRDQLPEEGSWTPVIVFASSDGDLSHAKQVGRYTKIGRIVVLTGQVEFSETTGSGAITLSGFPFTSLNLTDHIIAVGILATNFSGISGGALAQVSPNVTVASMFYGATGTATVFDETNSGASSVFQFTITFIT